MSDIYESIYIFMYTLSIHICILYFCIQKYLPLRALFLNQNQFLFIFNIEKKYSGNMQIISSKKLCTTISLF